MVINKTFNLTKNPNNGGSPAKENNAPEIIKQRTLLDLLKSIKSERSLFNLLFLVFLSFNSSSIPHKHTPEPV